MNLKKFLIVTFWLGILWKPSSAQNTDIQAWVLFNENKREQAENAIEQAIKKDPDNADLYLYNCIIKYSLLKTKESLPLFKKYFSLSDNPFPALYALSHLPILSFNGVLDKPALDFVTKCHEDPRASGTIKAYLAGILSEHYQLTYSKKAQEMMATVSPHLQWQVVGPFDNTSGSGFDKAYPPISQPSAKSFQNKIGAEITWRKVPSYRLDGWVDYELLNTNISNSIFFGQSFIFSPIDQTVNICIGVSGSMKAWLNDALMGQEKEERNTGFDVYNYQVALHKGYNRICIQTGNSEINRNNFLLRITDQKFNAIPTITSTNDNQPYKKEVNLKVKQIGLFAETHYLSQISKQKDNSLLKFLLAQTYQKNGKYRDSKKIFSELLDKYPNSSIFLQFSLINARELREYETQSLLQNRLLDQDPYSNFSLESRFDEEIQKEDYSTATAILDTTEKIYGSNKNTDLNRINVLAKQNKIQELIPLVNSTYKKYQNDFRFVNLKSILEKQSNNNYEAVNILSKFNNDIIHYSCFTSLYNLYSELGLKSNMKTLLQKMSNNIPYSPYYLWNLCNFYFDNLDYKNSLKMAQQCLEFLPYSDDVHEKIGLILEAQGDKQGALEAYKKSLYYEPFKYSVIKKIRNMEGKKNIESIFVQENISAIAKNAPKKPTADENSSILLHDVQTILYPTAGTEQRTILLIKTFNSTGVTDWKEYTIPFNSYRQRLFIEKSEIIKANGSKIQADINENQIVFTSLEPGDIIHLNYRTENYSYGKLAKHFWDDFNFNYMVPSKLSKYSILAANDRKFEYKTHNTDIKPQISTLDDFTLYSWVKEENETVKNESLMPEFEDVSQSISVSTLPNWAFVADWYSDLASSKSDIESEVKETVNKLLPKYKMYSELERAKIIYNYIVGNIQYSSVSFRQGAYVPQKADKTLTTKLGDCKDLSTLFVAMCREVELNASLVLVSTRQNGQRISELPTIDFNHCISKLKVNNQDYFIELTWNNLPFGTTTYSLKNAIFLEIPTANSTAAPDIKTYNFNQLQGTNSISHYTEITVENNNTNIKKDTYLRGFFAARGRDEYKNQKKETVEKQLLSKIANIFHGAANLNNYKFTNLENLSDTMVLNSDFSIANSVTNIGNLKVIPLTWSDGERSLEFLEDNTRLYDVDYYKRSINDQEFEQITLIIPESNKFKEIPNSTSFSFKDMMEYNISFKLIKPNTLVAARTFKLKKGNISKSDYQELRKFFSKIIVEDTRQVGFQ